MAIVVSHLGPDFDALARAALRQLPLADIVELRLDLIGDPGEERLRSFVQAAKKPVIVSVHGTESQGAFAGSVDEHCAILQTAARAGCAFVDVDWSLALELGELENPRCHRIVSRHDFSGTPKDLATFEEEVRAVLGEGDLIKLVTLAHDAADGLRLLRYLRGARGGMIAFCAGEAGQFTRALCPMFGSAFTYAAPATMLSEPSAPLTAPGQLRVNDLRGLLPPSGVHPGTAVFAVVGKSVLGSFSPHVHGMALKTAQLDAVFVALQTGDFQACLELMDDACFRGLAVTAPHKQMASELAKARDSFCEKSGAANTLVRDGKGWRAFNSDALAVKEVLERVWPFHLQKQQRVGLGGGPLLAGSKALILGAGGAARAAAWALSELGAEVSVAARRMEAARALAKELRATPIEWAKLREHPYEILVQATPVGSDMETSQGAMECVIPPEWILPRTLVIDSVYRPVRTQLLLAATKLGCTAVPGAEWFVRQATHQFQWFTNTSPSDAVLRAAFENALTAQKR